MRLIVEDTEIAPRMYLLLLLDKGNFQMLALYEKIASCLSGIYLLRLHFSACECDASQYKNVPGLGSLWRGPVHSGQLEADKLHSR